MKKKLGIMVGLIAILLLGTLSGCGGSSYEEQTFALGDWELTITNDEVVYNEKSGCDCLFVYVTAENKSEKKLIYENTANVNVYQGGDYLSSASEMKNEDGKKVPRLGARQIETEPGKSVELVYGWELKDDRDVKVSFGGYTSAVKATKIDFKVKDRISDEWKAAMEKEKKEKAEKKSKKNVETEGFTADIAEGWYIDEFNDLSATIHNEALDRDIEVETSASWGTAQEWATAMAGNFQRDGTETVTVGGTQYIRLTISDDQYMLFADCTDGENAVRIYIFMMSWEDAQSQVELIKIK